MIEISGDKIDQAVQTINSGNKRRSDYAHALRYLNSLVFSPIYIVGLYEVGVCTYRAGEPCWDSHEVGVYISTKDDSEFGRSFHGFWESTTRPLPELEPKRWWQFWRYVPYYEEEYRKRGLGFYRDFDKVVRRSIECAEDMAGVSEEQQERISALVEEMRLRKAALQELELSSGETWDEELANNGVSEDF